VENPKGLKLQFFFDNEPVDPFLFHCVLFIRAVSCCKISTFHTNISLLQGRYYLKTSSSHSSKSPVTLSLHIE